MHNTDLIQSATNLNEFDICVYLFISFLSNVVLIYRNISNVQRFIETPRAPDIKLKLL